MKTAGISVKTKQTGTEIPGILVKKKQTDTETAEIPVKKENNKEDIKKHF